jgi:acetoin utilization protein AcuB
MKKELITLSPDDVLLKVRDVFDNNRIHHIPIIKDGVLQGLVSKSDYLFFCRTFDGRREDERFKKFRLDNHEVSDIMTTGVATLSPSDKVNVALELFNENLFHSIPIIEEGQLVGIVTTFDIIKTLSQDKQAINEYTK